MNLLFSFPGLSTTDDILDLLKLISSNHPDLTIAAQVALDGGYDPCNNKTFHLSKEKKREFIEPCDPGFVLDSNNELCYTQMQEDASIQTGKDFCSSLSAEILTFVNDVQIQGFLQLFCQVKSFIYSKIMQNFYISELF